MKKFYNAIVQSALLKKIGTALALFAPFLSIVSFALILADVTKFRNSNTFHFIFLCMAFTTAIAYTFRYMSDTPHWMKLELSPIVGAVCWYIVGLISIVRYI